MAQTDNKVQKWIRWLETIQREVTQLVVCKEIFWSVQELINKNKRIQKPSEFYRYLGDTFIAYAVMGVRRQIKDDPQSVSMARLLGEIAQEPAKISRRYYQGLYSSSSNKHFADRHFDCFCEKAGVSHISENMVQKDLAELRVASKTCEDFGDKRVAHFDKRPPKILPRFKELNDVIETLHKLCLKCRLILLADCWTTLLPTYQYDWQEIFDFPWRLREQESE